MSRVALPAAVAGADSRFSMTRPALLVLMLVLCTGACLLSACLGAVQIPLADIGRIVAGWAGIGDAAVDEQYKLVFENIRLPRILFGLICGATMGICGTAMQGIFRNPLADPGLLGISSGAAFTAALYIVLGQGLGAIFGTWGLPLAAFAGSMLTGLLVYAISIRAGRIDVTMLLLAGIALNAIMGAGNGLLIFVAQNNQLRDISFWSLGSFGGITWQSLGAALPFMLLPLVVAPFLSRQLNVLLLGERDAANSGVSVERVKLLAIAITAGGVGSAVAFTGIIGFVGLVAPHIARLTAGSDNRWLMPSSALIGGILLVCADLVSRTIASPTELPVGVVTALIGAPFFMWLMFRKQKKRGKL